MNFKLYIYLYQSQESVKKSPHSFKIQNKVLKHLIVTHEEMVYPVEETNENYCFLISTYT